MLKNADANVPAETYAVSISRGLKQKVTVQCHIAVQQIQKHRKLRKIINLLFTAFSATVTEPTSPRARTLNLQRKTLIAWDAILILAKLASKTIQQLGYAIKKEMQLRTSDDAGVKR